MYREMTTKTKTTGPYQGVANPRNTGQIRNVTKTVRKKNRISHDQLYNVIQLGYHPKSGSSDFTRRALLKSFRMSSTATMQHKSGKMVSSFRKS
jgi:hypothetical protein